MKMKKVVHDKRIPMVYIFINRSAVVEIVGAGNSAACNELNVKRCVLRRYIGIVYNAVFMFYARKEKKKISWYRTHAIE